MKHRTSTRGLARIFGIVAALVVVALVVMALPAQHDSGHSFKLGVEGIVGIGLGQKLMMPSPVATYPFPDLQRRVRPLDATLPEANIDVLYDTQTYVAAGSQQLNYFSNVNADQTLSNMELAGSLPADTYFDVHRIFIDFLRLPTATTANTAAGLINDIAILLNTARGTLTFTQLAKPLGPIPIRLIGASGGVGNTVMASGRADAAGAIVQYGTSPDNGGWPANASLKLGPSTKFGMQLNFVNGVAISADTPIAITLLGIKYRRLA